MAQESLASTIRNNFHDMEIIGMTTSVTETVQWLKDHHPDLIFMDVELSDGKCFEIFNQINVDANIIMTTAYDSYAIKAFEAGSIDYLLKPINFKDLTRAIERARKRASINSIDLKSLLNNIQPEKKQYKSRIIVKLNDQIIPILTQDIAYIYSEDKNNYIITTQGHKFIIDLTLDEIIEELNPEHFFKISRGCIIESSAIMSITRQIGGRLKIETTPKCDFEMTVSRSRVDDFLVWLEK